MTFLFDHSFTQGKDISSCEVVVNFSQPRTTKGPLCGPQEFLPEHREGPRLNRVQGRCCEACKACWEKGAQLGTFSFYSEAGPAWGGGGRGPIKENPKTSPNTFTNYKGKLMLASSVGAKSGLSYLELNSTWKETLFFFPGKLKTGTEMDWPLCGKNTQQIPV